MSVEAPPASAPKAASPLYKSLFVQVLAALVLAFVFGPGHGMNIDASKLDASSLATHSANAHKPAGEGVGSFILNIIPTTSIDSLARMAYWMEMDGQTDGPLSHAHWTAPLQWRS